MDLVYLRLDEFYEVSVLGLFSTNDLILLL